MHKAREFVLGWLGWAFCELAFNTDMRGTEWSYRLGNWLYSKAYTPD